MRVRKRKASGGRCCGPGAGSRLTDFSIRRTFYQPITTEASMKEISSLRDREQTRIKIKMVLKGPDGKRISAKELFESLPKGTMVRFGGKWFPKLK
jgi:hypothetical protein